MRWLWAVFGAAMVGMMYYTPPPAPGESSLHYIMAGEVTTGEMICAVIATACLVVLVLRHTLKDQ